MNSVAELRKFICEQTGPRGLMPPDWVTCRRWKENLESADMYSVEMILGLLEVHYKVPFGAKDPLIRLVDIQKNTGLSKFRVRSIAEQNGILIEIGGRQYVRSSDYKMRFTDVTG